MENFARSVERYIPPELRPVVELAGMMNPVQGILQGMGAAGRGDYGEAAMETALGAAPIVGARLAGQPARAALAELFGFSGDDLARGIGSVAPSVGSRSRVVGRDVSPDDLQPSEGMTRRRFLGGLGAATAAGTMAGNLPLENLARGLGRASRGGLSERLAGALAPRARISELEETIKYPSGDLEHLQYTLRNLIRAEGGPHIPMEVLEQRNSLIADVRAKIDELQGSIDPAVREIIDLDNSIEENIGGLIGDIIRNPDDLADEIADLSDDEFRVLAKEILNYSNYEGNPRYLGELVPGKSYETSMDYLDDFLGAMEGTLAPRLESEVARRSARSPRGEDDFGDVIDRLRLFRSYLNYGE